MKDRPDYVNKHGFISQIGFFGRPDWMFVNEKDTVLVGYENLDKEAGYYHLKRYSGEKTIMGIRSIDYED